MDSGRVVSIPIGELVTSSTPLLRNESVARVNSDAIAVAHRRIEDLVGRFSPLIEQFSRYYGNRCQQVGYDGFKSAILDKFVEICFKGVQAPEEGSPHEKNFYSLIIRRACSDERRKCLRANRAVTFSQLDNFDSGMLPERGKSTHGDRQASSYLVEKLSQLGIEVTPQLVKILDLKIHAKAYGIELFREDIAEKLGISASTVKREIVRLRSMLRGLLAGEEPGVVSTQKNPETVARREAYRDLLQRADSLRLPERCKRFMSEYISLTSDGERPKEAELMARLGMTTHQVKRCYRDLNKFRPADPIVTLLLNDNARPGHSKAGVA